MDSPPPLPPPPPRVRDDDRTRRLLIGFAVWGAIVFLLLVVLGVALAVYAPLNRHGNSISVRTPQPTISAVRLHPPS
jgi:hypothetical protein